MPPAPKLSLSAVVLASDDPRALATFYERLLGFERTTDEPDCDVRVWIEPAGHPSCLFVAGGGDEGS
jgi:hypothetical protein